MKYYLYRHIRLDTNEVFYIGIGTKINKEFYSNHKHEFYRAYRKSNRTKYWKNITNKTEYNIEILLESNDYEFIKNKEIEFIELYGKKINNNGTLVNITDGGEGVTGTIISNEHRQKISNANRGKIPWNKNMKMSEEYINIRKGKSFEDQFGAERANIMKENQRIRMKGKYKGKLNPNYGKKTSEETKIKMGTPCITI